ncbi:insulinase family protein [Hymenobacter lutimineralis]|uniref:Insulinase family protein n=1 Tax=Hymenobacter lutimineralis TaxID=2606448 RepID=A0A5D6V4S6_9BACT|nr:pitrilysin family protein [Hymenobacter lutimineralis]TYZ10155.1 insulinase family protein [Hymenobacter lutimineralis]
MLDRLVAPPVQPLASVPLPAADVLLLPNGSRLHVLRNAAQPVIRLQVVFKAGKWYDTTPGVSLLTARMLLEGTRSRSARQIADEVAFFGASLECEQGFDRATLTLYCLARHLEKLLPLVADVLIEPTFPESELTPLKMRTIQNVRIERQKTSYLAAERFSHNVFGAQSPYGIVFQEDRFQSVTPEALHLFFQQAYALSGAEIFLCGDVQPAHEQAVQASLGAITRKITTSSNTASVTPAPQPFTDYVTVPDSIQSSLRIGRLWPSPHHPDTHRLQLLVKVLGGYFGSRLMKNIREDKGFTYGIYASVTPREHATSFVIGTDVNAASTTAAVTEVQRELLKLQEELIPEDELTTVKNYMAGKFANELSTVFEQCDKYKSTVFLGLPASYYADFLAQIQTATAPELQQLAQQYFQLDGMLQVIAGPGQI